MHPAELAVNSYLIGATKGTNKPMSESTIEQVGDEIKAALTRQFGGNGQRGDFRLRMSNLGRPACQLWYDKNEPEGAEPFPTTFVMNMMIGDIVESVFKAILTESGVAWEKPEKVKLELENDTINGEYDIIIDGKLDDIKSASNWSYTNKFESYEALAEHDDFGYVSQLAGYAKAKGVPVGGWWVINKANGHFKYIKAEMDLDKEIATIQQTVDTVNTNVFKRCGEAIPETFRKVPSGNYILDRFGVCGWCKYKWKCWKTLDERPSEVSQAKNLPMVYYVEPDKEAY